MACGKIAAKPHLISILIASAKYARQNYTRISYADGGKMVRVKCLIPACSSQEVEISPTSFSPHAGNVHEILNFCALHSVDIYRLRAKVESSAINLH